MKKSGKFQNQVVWITGGGSGIGKAMALEFCRQGAQVVVSGRRKDKLEQVVQEIQNMGGTALAIPCDITQEREVKETVTQILSHFSSLHVVVANAGYAASGRFEKLSLQDWRRQLETNFFGTLNTIYYSLEEIKKNNGRIAIIGSVMGSIAFPRYGPYQASKFALRAVSLTLSMELASTGASCTHIQPGFVESEIVYVDNQGQFREDWKNREDKRPSFLTWPASKAASVIVKAIYKRKREYVFTGHGKLAVFLANHFPRITYFFLERIFRKKRRNPNKEH